MVISFAGHHKVFSKEIYLSGITYDINTSKMTFLSNMSLQRMSKRLYKASVHVCRTNN